LLNVETVTEVPCLLRSPSFTLRANFAITRKNHSASFKANFPTGAVSHNASPPIASYHDQDERFAGAYQILREALASRVFPATSIAVTHEGKLIALRSFGRFTFDPTSSEATNETIFDLASVSKVVATTAMAMILYQRGLLDLEMPVISIVAEFGGEDPRRDEITLRMLLAHSAGLPAYERLFQRAHTRQELLQAAFTTELVHEPGSHAEYSDIGFIVLGTALERLADEALDRFCQREVFGPLGMTHTTFNPATALRASIAPTVDDQTFRHRVVQGEVQDENASVLGGVAGHAGLFSTAQDVAAFAHTLLQGGPPVLRPETLALFTTRESSPEGTSRALGWDTPSKPSQSGQYFSPRSFGHLGYTGSSLWIDPERSLSVTMLSNRTWPDSTNKAIQQVRPRFHDAVFQTLYPGELLQ
jgi:serine-type D-Ala-D-Ala carboxypeptidase